MRSIRRHLTYSNVMVTILAFIVLSGGTAVALSGTDTVQSDDLGPGAQVKAPDVAANAVNGSDVLDSSLGIADLNANSRPHKLEFSAPRGTAGATVIATVANVSVYAECTTYPGTSEPELLVNLKNLANQTGTVNALITSQTASDGPVALNTVGQFVSAGAFFLLQRFDNPSPTQGGTARGNFNRVEGQVVFRTPGRVTTIDFHAFAGGDRCEFYGTAVTSNLS
jgi:hypothetical protein